MAALCGGEHAAAEKIEAGLVTAKLCKMAILYKTHILSKVTGQKPRKSALWCWSGCRRWTGQL
jgi:hypothetical protein